MASERESEVGDRASQMGEASEGAMATQQIMHRILILSRLIRHFLRSLSLSLTHTHVQTRGGAVTSISAQLHCCDSCTVFLIPKVLSFLLGHHNCSRKEVLAVESSIHMI